MSIIDNEKILLLLEKVNAAKRELNEDEVTSILTSLQQSCRVPPLQNPSLPYSATDFEGVASDAEIHLSVMLQVLNSVHIAKNQQGQQFTLMFLRHNMVSCFLAACEYYDDSWEWSSAAAASVSHKIMRKLCEVYSCSSVGELLTNFPHDVDQSCQRGGSPPARDTGLGYVKAILQKFSETLNRDNWKKYPGLKMSYWWILENINPKDLGEQLVFLLPPALFIVDDWEQKNKLLGLQCLQYIIDNTTSSELRWYGRGAVIYDALKPLLYSREPEVLESLYPAIISVAKILEADPASMGKLKSENSLDFIMRQLLQEMAYEQKLLLRSVYATALSLILPALNLHAIRWSKELMDVCSDYLATFESTAAQDRIKILKALQSYVEACWPQVHSHAYTLLKMVVRLIYDVTEKESCVESESVQVITQEAESLVLLLHTAAPKTVEDLCQGLQDVPVHPQCQLVFHHICCHLSGMKTE